jgi:hypothetical protein
MKPSFHSLIPFLLFCNCQFRIHDSIQFLCSPAHILSRNSNLHSMLLLTTSELFSIITLHGPHRKHSLSDVGKACLQRCCIATEVTRLLFAYSLPWECVYSIVASQWTSSLISRFRISVVMSQYIQLMIVRCKATEKLILIFLTFSSKRQHAKPNFRNWDIKICHCLFMSTKADNFRL